MPHVALYQPEIPPNTGNIIRLCANMGFELHLIHPLGFTWDDRRLKRAGMDYGEWARVRHHDDWASFQAQLSTDGRLFALSTRGHHRYTNPRYRENDVLLFGPETRGLPQAILDELPAEQRLCIPMQENSRSLNLSNATAIVAYEMWRQLDFSGAADPSCS